MPSLLRDTIRQMLESYKHRNISEKYTQHDLALQSRKMPTFEEYWNNLLGDDLVLEMWDDWFEWDEETRDFKRPAVTKNVDWTDKDLLELTKASWEREILGMHVPNIQKATVVVRTICFDESTPDQLADLGIYWSDPNDPEYEHYESGGFWSTSKRCFKIKAQLDHNHIDWAGTLNSRTVRSFESEIRLMKGSPVFVLSYVTPEGDEVPVNKMMKV